MRTEDHREHIYRGEPDEDLIESLEPDQLVQAMDRPIPRRNLRGVTEAALWLLRIFLLVITALAIWVFVSGLRHG